MTTSDAVTPRVRFGAVLLSEWTKLRTLPVTGPSLLCFLLISAMMSFLLTSGAAEEYATLTLEDQVGVSSLTLSLYGLLASQLVIAVLGSMVMTSEYSSGSIMTSLVAVPRRGRLLAAKAIVVSMVAFVAGIVGSLAMVLIGGLSFGEPQVGPFEPLLLSDSEAWWAVWGSGLYMAAVALMSLAVGTLVRHSAGALGLLITGILLVPSMFESLPEPLSEMLAIYWPTNAGLQIVLAGPDGLAPWAGFCTMAGFTALLVGVAYVVFRVRDA